MTFVESQLPYLCPRITMDDLNFWHCDSRAVSSNAFTGHSTEGEHTMLLYVMDDIDVCKLR